MSLTDDFLKAMQGDVKNGPVTQKKKKKPETITDYTGGDDFTRSFLDELNRLNKVGEMVAPTVGKIAGDIAPVEDAVRKVSRGILHSAGHADMSLEELEKAKNTSRDPGDRLRYTARYNEKLLAGNAEILAKTQMDGTNHSVLDEMKLIAQMESGKEKKQRKAAVLSKMEELGVDTSDYALYAGDSNFSLGAFGDWAGNAAMSGLASFNKGITSTADVLLGNPLKAMGWENNPVSELADYYGDVYDSYKYSTDLMAQKLGGGKGYEFAGAAIEGVLGAVPNALLAIMSAGTSMGATTTSLTTQAAAQSGNLLTKAGLTTSAMAKNPQYWLSFARTFGTDYEEAKAMGASDATATLGATLTSLINAGIEIGIDGGSGIQGLPDDLKKGGSKALKWAVSAAEEGGEEGLQKFVNEIVAKTMYDSDAEILNPKEYAREIAIGAISGAALGGGQVATQKVLDSAAKAAQERENAKLTENEQKVVDKVTSDRIAEQEQDGKKLTDKAKKQIREAVIRAMEDGSISTDTIEEVLGGETYKTYKDTIDSEDAIKREFDILNKMKQGEMTGEQIDRRAELKEQLEAIKKEAKRDQLKSQLGEEVMVLTKGDRLSESYNEKRRRGQAFEADLSKYDAKQQKVIQKAVESGILNNTNRTHKFVDMIAKISADKGVLFDFTNNKKLKESGFAIDGKTVNGYVTKDGVTLNINSAKALNSVVGHEITHVLQGTEFYAELQKTLFDYAKAKGDYQGRLDSLTKLYEGVEGTDIEEELTADLVGDYLFTDADFVNRLSTENRNVFQQIYDEIKYLCKVVTAGSKEARQLEKAKKIFEDAFRAEAKNTVTEDGVRYALSERKVQDIQSIGRKSINSFSSYEIQKTEPLARKYQEEMGTKSPYFRAWFGDWRANDDQTVNTVTTPGNTRGIHRNADTGWKINISSKVKTQNDGHGALGDKAAKPYLQYLDGIVENAILLDSSGSDPKSINTLLMHSMYAVADVGAGPEVLKLYVEEMNDPNSEATTKRAYTLVNIEKAFNAGGRVQASGPSSGTVASNAIKTVSDLFTAVKTYDANFSPNPSSKVVNADGTPKVVYHGTNATFNVFQSQSGEYWFSEYEDYAESMMEERGGGEVKSVYLNMRNPYRAKLSPGQFTDPTYEAPILRNAKAAGYDGVIIENDTTDPLAAETFYVVFNPEQIKSATDNIGIFDGGNPDIRYSLSEDGEQIAPYGNYNVSGKDIALDIAPVAENATVQEKTQLTEDNSTGMFPDDFPIRSDMFPDDFPIREELDELYQQKKALENRMQEARNAGDEDALTDASNAYGAVTARIGYLQPENVESVKEMPDNLENAPTKPKKRGMVMKGVTNFVDKGMVFENLSLETKNMELQAKWDYALPSKAEGRAQRFMERGNARTKSLDAIMKQVGPKTHDFSLYLYHLHNIDRMTLETRFGIANKTVFGELVTADASRQVVQRLEKANPEFKKYAEDVYAYNRNLREMLVEGGMITQETADLWEKMYPHYVPISRDATESINGKNTRHIGISGPVKKATGGNGNIHPLFQTMAERTIQTYKSVARNDFGVELKNTLGSKAEALESGVDDIIDSIGKQESLLGQNEKGSPTFTVFEDGKRVTFDITEDMLDALKPTSEGLAYRNKVLTKVSGFRRNLLTTWNPVFALYRNPVKDLQEVFVNSQHPVKTYANIPTAAKELFTNGKWATEYLDNGGDSNSYYDKETGTFGQEESALKKAIGIGALEKAGDFIEKVPRLAEYIASRQEGQSVQRSMLDSARVTTNFAAGGDVTKFLNAHGFSFLNASVQGFSQHVRNVREAKMNGLKGTVKMIARYTLAGLPGLLNHLLWEDDEDYGELSPHVKQNYYIIGKTEKGKFIRIPKGRTAAVAENALEQMGNLVTGNDEADFGTFFELFMNNIAPNNPMENNILAPIVQVANNKTWYGEDLVPSRLADLPAEEQFDESTDAISKWLGEKAGISPVKLNYLLDQYSGGLGDVILPMLTPEAESGDDTILGNLIAPWKKELTTDRVLNNKYPSAFYELKDAAEIVSNGRNATAEDKLRNQYLESVGWDMSSLYAEKREVQNSDLTDSEKYEQVRQLQEQINSIAEEALNEYQNVSIDGDYAMVGDRVYKLSEDGEWSKLSDEEFTKYEVTKAAGSAYYATDGTNHYKYTVKDGYGTWYKISEDELKKQREVTKGLGISPEEYWRDKTEYTFAYNQPENYAVAKAVGGYDAYTKYSRDLYNIKADKDKNGKSISGSKQAKVLDYINNLDADYYTKLILYKSQYNSYDAQNDEILEYLNSRTDLTYQEKVSILKKLGADVDSEGRITW